MRMKTIAGFGVVAALTGCAATKNNVNMQDSIEKLTHENGELKVRLADGEKMLAQERQKNRDLARARLDAAGRSSPVTSPRRIPQNLYPSYPYPPMVPPVPGIVPAVFGGPVFSGVPPADPNGDAVMPFPVDESKVYVNAPAPWEGLETGDRELTIEMMNMRRYAVSLEVNGRTAHFFGGGLERMETPAIFGAEDGVGRRVPMIRPGSNTARLLMNRVGPQHVVVKCWSYVTGQPAQIVRAITRDFSVPTRWKLLVTDEECRGDW